MIRKRKKSKSFQRLALPRQKPGDLSLWFLADGDHFNLGFSMKPKATIPEWYIVLDRNQVEEMVANLCAYMMGLDVSEMKEIHLRILDGLKQEKREDYH
jgi:hypothetical protein